MIYIDVVGGRKKEREVVEEIIWWSVKRLMPRVRKLDITVNLRGMLFTEGAFGWCFEADNRDYVIDVHKKVEDFESRAEYIKTFLHEMVHVMQGVTGLSRQTWGGKWYWKGKDYSNTPYSKQPWERQAFRMQESLYEELAKERPDLVK
jgi:hypothetical protein